MLSEPALNFMKATSVFYFAIYSIFGFMDLQAWQKGAKNFTTINFPSI